MSEIGSFSTVSAEVANLRAECDRLRAELIAAKLNDVRDLAEARKELERLFDWLSPDVYTNCAVEFSANAIGQVRAICRALRAAIDAARGVKEKNETKS